MVQSEMGVSAGCTKLSGICRENVFFVKCLSAKSGAKSLRKIPHLFKIGNNRLIGMIFASLNAGGSVNNQTAKEDCR